MFYLSIILQTWLVWCVTGRPLPCTIVENEKGPGAMLCCDYQPLPHEEGLSGIKAQSNDVIHSEKKCTLMTPKTSLGLMKEVWSLRNYTWASGMLKTKLPYTKDIPRSKGCCYEEQFVFSISNEGISAQTGKTHKIVHQDQYVQPILSLLCVRNDDCHNSGNMKVFQRMEGHGHYVESEDHPEYVHEELLLKPSGCLCVPHTQEVKPDIGEILIPMNLIEEAMTDSHVVKRNVEYPTELPEILRLALEIMREPNPLPVLDSIERQMALQLQQTRYFAAIAMASGLPGGFGPNQRNLYEHNQQGNLSEADMGPLKEFPLHSYQLILSAFLSGLALGQNFQNISQIEILDRLIVDNGNSGINLLETILKLQNNSLDLDFNSLEFDYNSFINITNIDSNGTSSNETYDTPPFTKLIDNTTKVIDSEFSSPTYVTITSYLSSTTYVTDSDLSSPIYVTTSSDLSSTDSVTAYSTADAMFDTITETSNDTSSEKEVVSTSASVDSTRDDAVTTSSNKDFTTDAASVDQTSFQKVDFVSNDSITDSTSDTVPYSFSDEESTTSDGIADFITTFNEEITPNAAALVDSTTDNVVYISSDKEPPTPAAMVDNIADSHFYFDGEATTNTPAVVDGATERGYSTEDYLTNTATPMVGNIAGGTIYPEEDSTTYHEEDSTTYHEEDLTTYHEEDSTTYHEEDSTAYHEDSTAYHEEDFTTYHEEDFTTYHEEDFTTYHEEDFTTYHGEDFTTYHEEDFTTYVPSVTDSEVQHVSSNEDDTIYSAAVVDGTTGPVGHTSYNEDYTTETADIVVTTEESDNIVYIEDDATSNAEPAAQTSDNQDYSTDAAEIIGSTTEPDENSTTAPAMVDNTAEPVVHTSYSDDDATVESTEPSVPTSSNEENVSASNISAESEVPESPFDLHEYIMGLPQFQPLTINTELLMHIMFPPEPITHDERGH